jgi:glutathione S-transferase
VLILSPIVGAGNFHPDYVKVNRNGTIPSLTSDSLKEPLIESTDILIYLNKNRPAGVNLAPKDQATEGTMKQLMDIVHSPEASTNIILFDARDPEEMKAKQNSGFGTFLGVRQDKLEGYCQQFPDNEFYKARRDGNGSIHKHYVSSDNHQAFFDSSNSDYRGFAAAMDKLDSLIVLPYATGPELTYADLHIVPWLSHAMMGAGGKSIDDFDPLESLIRKTVPDFRIGDKTKAWWANMGKRESFQKIYHKLR